MLLSITSISAHSLILDYQYKKKNTNSNSVGNFFFFKSISLLFQKKNKEKINLDERNHVNQEKDFFEKKVMIPTLPLSIISVLNFFKSLLQINKLRDEI